MSDLHRADLHQEKLPILAAPPHESRIMVAVAMTAIALAFVLSLAVAVSSITHGVMTAASGLPPPALTAPETTGTGDRS